MEDNRPIIVAQIMTKWYGAGVESVIMNYYRHIDKTKIQFDFICDEDSTDIPYEEIELLGGKVYIVPRYQKIFKYINALIKIFKENNYKIVHSNLNTMSIFPLFAAYMAKVPVRISHAHTTSNKKEWKKNILKNILKLFSKLFVTDFFACSEKAGRYQFGNKLYDSGRVTIVNNAIDLNIFKYNEQVRIEKRKEMHILDSTMVIGHIGRFVEQKNHSFLIEIFDEIHKRINDSILLLAGQGPLEDAIKQKVSDFKINDCVRFLGQRADVSELYQVYDAFVLPSLYEGLPVVGVEAQATGNLCILSDDMTKETKILDSTKFMSLSNTAEEWADTILKDVKNYKKHDTLGEVSRYGFNIDKEAIKLESKYLEMIKYLGG